MSEKRILCVEVSGNCRNLREVGSLILASLFNVRKVGSYCSTEYGWKKITKTQCKNCNKAEYVGITREQAVEKMAKAMCRKSNGGTCDGCSVFEEPDKERCKEIYMHPEFVDGAEAALNGLLEAPNGK